MESSNHNHCILEISLCCRCNMDPKSLAGEIIHAGADRVLEKNPKRVDDALANTVIKQGANALESGASKGNVDPGLGAAAEVNRCWNTRMCM